MPDIVRLKVTTTGEADASTKGLVPADELVDQRPGCSSVTGLRGDRYFEQGSEPERHLTLIEAEQLEDFTARTGLELTAAESRRQLTTYGVRLNPLVGRRFMVGDVECRGIELCEPCRDLERVTRNGVLKGMVHRAGLNAEIISGGEIAVGARVRPLDG